MFDDGGLPSDARTAAAYEVGVAADTGAGTSAMGGFRRWKGMVVGYGGFGLSVVLQKQRIVGIRIEGCIRESASHGLVQLVRGRGRRDGELVRLQCA